MAYNLKSKLKEWNLEHKHILLRADLNVPIHNGTITNDYRLKQVQKTINYILNNNGIAILASHLGRPTHQEEEYSLKQLLPWFIDQGYEIQFSPTIDHARHDLETMKAPQILLLENLRFFKGEQTEDPQFAKALAALGDYYVNDAFGTMHRTDTSITLVPHHFALHNRSIGFLVEHELQMLNPLLVHPEHPFVLALGGGKVHEKINLMRNLMSHVDSILICPALSFSFMHALGLPTGKSLVDTTSVELCRDILAKTQQHNIPVILPIDYQVASGTKDGALRYTETQNIEHNEMGINIGPQTEQLFAKTLSPARTIFYNGLMGFQERPETLKGTHALLSAISRSNAYTVIGGGDTVGTAEYFGLDPYMSFCSTGGGATIAYLSGEKLPGIETLITP
ncbi:MAG TPA: phosphoglycerate kinase [Candidatus Dependentiae bacterium]|nr:phosphoglycerate kinase [Candidatus Dependentiae bacterium]